MAVNFRYDRGGRPVFPADLRPEPEQWNGDPPAMPSASDERDEDLERDWSWLVAELRQFKAKHGMGRMMRCVADAVSEQGSLLK